MNELTINDRFRLLLPESVRVMSDEEREKRDLPGDRDTLCLTDEAGSMIVSIGSKTVGAVANLILYLIKPAVSMEASVNQAMSGYGYRKETSLSREIGGCPAQGFRFTYTAGGPMVGESYVVREGRSLTFFHVYLREDRRDACLALWERLLDGVQSLKD